MPKYTAFFAVAIAFSFVLVACGGGGGNGSSDTELGESPVAPDPQPEEPAPQPGPDPEPIVSTVTFEAVSMPTSGLVTLFEASYAPTGSLFASTQEGTFGDGSAGIWRSTDDGSSWTQVFDQNVSFISLLSGDPNWVVAGGDSFYAISSNSGASWTTGQIKEPIFGTPLRITAASGHTPGQGIFLASSSAFNPGLYRSTNQGATWQYVFTEDDVVEFGEPRLQHVEVSLTDPRVIYTATGFDTGIWKSVNTGGEFFSIKTGVAAETFVFTRGIAVNPRDSDQIFIYNNVSINGGANWSVAGVSPQDTIWYKNRLIRVKNNALIVSQDGGASWSVIAGIEAPRDSGVPSNIWKSQDSLFFEISTGSAVSASIYRLALSEIEKLMD